MDLEETKEKKDWGEGKRLKIKNKKINTENNHLFLPLSTIYPSFGMARDHESKKKMKTQSLRTEIPT